MANSSANRPSPIDRAEAHSASPTHSGGNLDATVDGGARASVPPEVNVVRPGAKLDVYELVEKVGEGGMGSVWKARHTRLDKLVALKVLPAHLTSDPAAVNRFEREMKAVGKLEHAHIVRAMDAGDFDGLHYLVMELVEGSDLNRLVKERGPRSINEACQMIRQAALGLAHAHAHGLVHRDIKPSNLLLSKQGQVKILDLGLARLQEEGVGDATSGLTAQGTVLGTPDYMSPEQWESTHTVGPACDLYALGCTLFFLLTGRAPFGDTRHSTMVQKMKGHALEEPPRLRSLRDDVPEEIDELCSQLLAKQPQDRLGSAQALAAQLQAILKRLAAAKLSLEQTSRALDTIAPFRGAASAGPPSTIALERHSVATPPETPPVVTSPQPQAPRRKSSTSWLLGGGAALLALLAGAIWFSGILLRVQTPAGTIVLRIDQPEIAGAEVAVDGQQKITLKAGRDQEPITIVADEKQHLLRVSKGGFETFTKQFTVDAGKATEISVHLEPVKTTAPPEKAIPPATTVAATEPGRLPTSGSALRLNGKSSYVEVPWKYDGTHPLTVEAWTIAERPSEEQRPEFLIGDMEVAGWGIMRNRAAGNLLHRRFQFYFHDGAYHRIASQQPPPVGQPVHVAAVFDGQQARLYVDGKLQASEPIPNPFTKSAMPTLIGGNPNVGDLAGIDSHWQGTVDEVRFSNVARYMADFTPKVRFEPDGETIVLYHFDEGRGGEARDSSGNNRHGKLLGGEWVEATSGKLVNLAAPPPRDPTAGSAVAMLGGGSVAIPTLTYQGGPLTMEAWVWHPLPAVNTFIHSPGVIHLPPFNLKFYAPSQSYQFVAAHLPDVSVAHSPDQSLLPGKWVHLAGQWDEQTLSFFIDGQPTLLRNVNVNREPTPEQILEATQAILKSAPRTAATLGGSPLKDASRWTGALDEIRISSVARYTEAFTPKARFEPDEQTLALLHCDEADGWRLVDSSGKNHHGEFRGTGWAWITSESCRPTAVPSASDPQRALAEWAIRVGGSVALTQGAEFPKFTSIEALPPGPLRLAEINVEGSTLVTDADLPLLRGLNEGSNLNLNDTPVTAAKVLDEIAGMKLWHVALNGIFLTAEDVERLAGMPGINHRLYMGNSGLSDASFARLTQQPTLEVLHIGNTRVSDASIVPLAAHGKLTMLSAWQTPLTDASLKALAACKNLKSLNVEGTKVTELGVKQLREALPECQVAWDPAIPFQQVPTDRETLQWVFQHKGKAWISISGGGTREARTGDEQLRVGVWVTHIEFSECQTIQDADLTVLAGLTSLNSITLHNTPVSVSALLDQIQHIPAIEELGLNGLKPTPADVARLAQLPNGKRFMVWDCGLTDDELRPLLVLPQLQTLNVGNSKLSDAGLERLGGKLELTQLFASGTGITDEGLKVLATCPKLVEFEAKGTKVTQQGVDELAKALPQCRITWDGGTAGPAP
jgi:serine/threonine protein kinase